MPVAAPVNLETDHRLLEAAGEVFAEKGFRDATIREICARADANVAAVNYHFGDKEGLYAAVLKYARRCASHPLVSDNGEHSKPPQERLHEFVHNYLLRIFDNGRPAWHARLMAREMLEPTRALDKIVTEQVGPNHARLRGIIREIVGNEVSDETIRHCALSVVGQCVFYNRGRPVIERLYPEQKFTPRDIERLADHITAFSLGALKEIRRSAKAK
jgi:AcrR family transcriptional regulator